MRQLVLVVIFVIVVNVIGAIMRARAQKKEMERRREIGARAGAAGGPVRMQQGVRATGAQGVPLPPPPTGPMGGPLHARESGRAGIPPARRGQSSGARSERGSDDRAFPSPRDVAAGRRDDAMLRGATRAGGDTGPGRRFGGAMDEERLLAGRQAETARRTASRHRVEAENLERNEQILQRGLSERAERATFARGQEARGPLPRNPFERPERPDRADRPDRLGASGSAGARSISAPGARGVKAAEPVTAYTQGVAVGVHADLLAVLRTPQGLRNAILVREILDTPPGLR